MPSLITSFVLLLHAAAAAEQSECIQAMEKYQEMQIRCPVACYEDSESERDGIKIPKCTEGQKERTPKTCRSRDCADYIRSMSDSVIEAMNDGLSKCNDKQMAMGADILRFMIKGLSMECGVPESFNANLRPDSCGGAMWYGLHGVDEACPQHACWKENECPQRACDDNCFQFMHLDTRIFDHIPIGLQLCGSHSNLGVRRYAQYANGSDGRALEALRDLQTFCNQTNNTGNCTRISGDTYKEAMSKGLRPMMCIDG